METILRQFNLEISTRHHALNDAQMTAELWITGLELAMERGVATLGELYHFLSQVR